MKSGERGCSLNPKVAPSSQVDGRAADFTPSCAATTVPHLFGSEVSFLCCFGL